VCVYASLAIVIVAGTLAIPPHEGLEEAVDEEDDVARIIPYEDPSLLFTLASRDFVREPVVSFMFILTSSL